MRAYQYRIYANKEQIKCMNLLLFQARRVWNVLWNEYKIIWNRDDLTQSKSWQAQTKRMRAVIQKHPETYGLLHNDTISLIGQRFGLAWNAAFEKRKKGEPWEPPQYKHKHTYGLPLRYRGRSCKYEPANGRRCGKLTILNVPGVLRVREHRALPNLPIKQVNIRSERDGKWYASFVFDESAEVPCKRHGPPVGIDLGLKTRVMVSDGRSEWALTPTKWTAKYEAQLRVLDRKRDRRKPKPFQKASKRYRKACRERAKLMAKIARCRADWLHNASTWIAESFEQVYCEDTSTAFMLKNKHLSKSAADASLAEFKRMLAYKCGDRVTFIDPAYTTQTCSRCGDVKPKELSERMHKCDKCGLVMDRDANAARNILARGLKQEKGAAA